MNIDYWTTDNKVIFFCVYRTVNMMDSVISLVKQQLVKTSIILCTPHNIHKVLITQVTLSIFHDTYIHLFVLYSLLQYYMSDDVNLWKTDPCPVHYCCLLQPELQYHTAHDTFFLLTFPLCLAAHLISSFSSLLFT